MTNLKASSGQIDQSGDFNFTGDLKKGGVDVALLSDTYGKPVIPVSGGGLLTANRVNEITDGDVGYLLPLAASVAANIVITITLNVVDVNPQVTASGADTITNIDVTDTDIVFDAPTTIQLASNGLDNWRFV